MDYAISPEPSDEERAAILAALALEAAEEEPQAPLEPASYDDDRDPQAATRPRRTPGAERA